MSPVVKVVLAIIGVLLLLGIISAAVMGYMAYRVSKAVTVDSSGEVTSVETPWGKVTTDTDSAKVANNLGVEIYPGAKALEGASGGSFGNLSFGSAEFETTDPLAKVAEFYKGKYANGTWGASGEDDFSMLVGTDKGMITISLERMDDKTIIRIGKTTAEGSGSTEE